MNSVRERCEAIACSAALRACHECGHSYELAFARAMIKVGVEALLSVQMPFTQIIEVFCEEYQIAAHEERESASLPANEDCDGCAN